VCREVGQDVLVDSAAASPDCADLLALAEELARSAGDLVRSGPQRVDVATTKTSSVDVVTAMDIAAEELLRRTLAQRRPQDGVLGEEQGLLPGTSGVTWVVDPIDGTVNYLYGIPAYAVSVAAVVGPPDPDGWTVLAGCVHAIADGRTFSAARGGGASVDGRQLRVNRPQPLSESLLGTGFGYTRGRRRAQARVIAALLPQVRDIRRIGSSSLDLCSVASGSLDVYFERGLRPWDLAAGSLIAQEAGGVVVGLWGEAPGEAMTVAGPAASVGTLVRLLEELEADRDQSD
jgi:myo-inositol-1(or 4)-monophosphatase